MQQAQARRRGGGARRRSHTAVCSAFADLEPSLRIAAGTTKRHRRACSTLNHHRSSLQPRAHKPRWTPSAAASHRP